jgi:hypothetical protein
MDEPELEVLTYRAFRERQTQLDWERRRRMYEDLGSWKGVTEGHDRSTLGWIRSAREWVSDQLWRTV